MLQYIIHFIHVIYYHFQAKYLSHHPILWFTDRAKSRVEAEAEAEAEAETETDSEPNPDEKTGSRRAEQSKVRAKQSSQTVCVLFNLSDWQVTIYKKIIDRLDFSER